MGGSLVTRATSITHSVQTTHIHSKLSVDNKNILLQHNNTHARVYFLKNVFNCLFWTTKKQYDHSIQYKTEMSYRIFR